MNDDVYCEDEGHSPNSEFNGFSTSFREHLKYASRKVHDEYPEWKILCVPRWYSEFNMTD